MAVAGVCIPGKCERGRGFEAYFFVMDLKAWCCIGDIYLNFRYPCRMICLSRYMEMSKEEEEGLSILSDRVQGIQLEVDRNAYRDG